MLSLYLSTSLFPKPFSQYFPVTAPLNTDHHPFNITFPKTLPSIFLCQCTSQITFPKTVPLIFLSMHLSNHFFQNWPNISGSMHLSNHFFQNCPLNISGSMHLSNHFPKLSPQHCTTCLSMSLFLKSIPQYFCDNAPLSTDHSSLKTTSVQFSKVLKQGFHWILLYFMYFGANYHNGGPVRICQWALNIASVSVTEHLLPYGNLP